MNPLIGRWVTDPDDAFTVDMYGWVTQEFTADGELIYTIHDEAADQIIFLTYRMEDCDLVTDQKSAPREERTTFAFDSDGALLLGRKPEVARFVRQASR